MLPMRTLHSDCRKSKQCKVITGPDTASAAIARVVAERYQELTRRRPHLVVSLLHRSRLDPNRDLPEAAQGNRDAIRAYEAFHGCIEDAHKSMRNRHGLHLDFHGYGDDKNQNNTIIGYLFGKQELNRGDFTRQTPSIQALLDRTRKPVKEILFGKKSLGSMLELSGYRAIPSRRLVLITMHY